MPALRSTWRTSAGSPWRVEPTTPPVSGNSLGAAVPVPVRPPGRRAFGDMPLEDFARLVASIREEGLNRCGSRRRRSHPSCLGAYA